jgi:hypothetical protein
MSIAQFAHSQGVSMWKRLLTSAKHAITIVLFMAITVAAAMMPSCVYA